MAGLEIVELGEDDATALANMFASDPGGYSQFFHPFEFDPASLAKHLRANSRDRWWGMRFSGRLVGMFMLRGLDEGYKRPSFGVYISHDNQGKGLATLALRYSMAWCYMNNIESMLVKVHNENERAEKLYRDIGFKYLGRSRDGSQVMLEYELRNKR